MKIRVEGRSDVGRERDQNEDTFVVDDELGFYAVCDGMGGHAAGEVAAAVGLEAAQRVVRQRRWILDSVQTGEGAPEALAGLAELAAREANRDVFALSKERDRYGGMGCTITMLLAAGDKAALASVGDSRFYLARHGRAQQLTLDHIIGDELVRSGAMKVEDMATFRYARMLSRAIGTRETIQADVFPLELMAGDRFVLCTDGFSNYVESDQWLAERLAQGDPAVVADALVAFANDSGGADNITVVVGRVEP